MSDALAREVVGYLSDGRYGHHCECVIAADPVPRRFRIRLANWWPLVEDLPEGPVRDAGRSALHDLQHERSVGRALLRDWALAVVCDPSDNNLIPLWIAVRVWGGLGRFGAGNVRLGFTDPNLVDSLRNSALEILGGDLAAAYCAFDVNGTKVSYSSKWFWAVSLARDEVDQHPLILDNRVKATLTLVAARNGVDWSNPVGCGGYLAYVELVHHAAALVRDGLSHDGAGNVDAENVEWLVFDRRPCPGSTHVATSDEGSLRRVKPARLVRSP